MIKSKNIEKDIQMCGWRDGGKNGKERDGGSPVVQLHARCTGRWTFSEQHLELARCCSSGLLPNLSHPYAHLGNWRTSLPERDSAREKGGAEPETTAVLLRLISSKKSLPYGKRELNVKST